MTYFILHIEGFICEAGNMNYNVENNMKAKIIGGMRMNNGWQVNDNLTRQNTDVPYDAKTQKRPLEEQNTLIVSHKKGWLQRLKEKLKPDNG